ncbi:MAG: type I DNA topoisomerase [Planctomycetia bacterium]|nr:type I DNA topoisomerase [Planctomycetia bacterium]
MSEKPLLIVESPSKATTISRHLGGEYNVIASVGHVKDLPKNALGVDIKNDFEITLEVLPKKKGFIKELKSLAKKAPNIILAMDPDREGEAIAAHIASEIPDFNIERVQFTEITKAGIKEGMQTRHPIDEKLVDAQITRRIIDRLVGYKISPILWATLQHNMKFVTTTLSAGRVQSATVKILIDRERERAAFKAATFYNLKAFLLNTGGKEFTASLYKLNEQRLASSKDFDKKTGELNTKNVIALSESQANTLKTELDVGTWEVVDIKEKPITSNPRPPFTTSTLQQEAGRKLRFTARRTMSVAQKLYEYGFITYMRTDSTHLSSEAINAARQEIQNRFGSEYLPEQPRQYSTKVKNAQEAHEAIRPAGARIKTTTEVENKLDKDAVRLYELIYKRTLACQMRSAKLKETTVLINNQKAVFRASGRVIIFPGYMRVYVVGRDDPDVILADKETLLPKLEMAENLSLKELNVVGQTTKPPARFTEASLIREMEAKGIGRPSTYAATIDTILRREYAEKKNGSLIPTYLAVAITQLLENHFGSLVDANFTANMEDGLDAISRGELKSLPFINEFYFGGNETRGLEVMLEEEVDIRKACAITIDTSGDEPIIARIGTFGPYLEHNGNRKSIPFSIPLGDLTPEKAKEILTKETQDEKTLGKDPKTGEEIYFKEGQYGPYVQLGDSKTRKSIPKEFNVDDVNLELALRLLALPREVGKHPETGELITADYGRYGPYLRCGKKNARIEPPLSPLTISVDEAVTTCAKKRTGSQELKTLGKHTKTGEELIVKTGFYGPYITDGKVNVSIPKGKDAELITLEESVELIDKKRAAGPTKRRRRKKKK